MIALSSPFSVSLKGSITTTVSYDKIVRDQLIDAITTNQGERVMNPDWGCNINAVLYDPSSSLERYDTASYIRDRLVGMLPRVIIRSVSVDVKDSEPNIVNIEIKYKASAFSPDSSISVGIDMEGTSSGN
jgi:phage baseplate assembly protein W